MRELCLVIKILNFHDGQRVNPVQTIGENSSLEKVFPQHLYFPVFFHGQNSVPDSWRIEFIRMIKEAEALCSFQRLKELRHSIGILFRKGFDEPFSIHYFQFRNPLIELSSF